MACDTSLSGACSRPPESQGVAGDANLNFGPHAGLSQRRTIKGWQGKVVPEPAKCRERAMPSSGLVAELKWARRSALAGKSALDKVLREGTGLAPQTVENLLRPLEAAGV